MTIPPAPGPMPVYKSKMFVLSKKTRKVGNITLRFEGFGDAGMDELAAYVDVIYNILPGALQDTKLGVTWFGLHWLKAQGRIRIVDRYLKNRCTSLTFVRKISGAKCDNCMVEASDYGQVLPTVLVDSQGAISKQNYADPHAENQIQRGLRIFISPFFTTDDRQYERLNCVFHEITHKVISTHDYKYGIDKCFKLAKNHDIRAIANADNYGYWIAAAALDAGLI